ncbi:hypothetical protein BOTNAR_0038g00320 [Botryotinia narcissicola]|uniref:Uncharacterized protein n=1 Tax=Botryotinia narcissicola TaxID=278944 RepID=A0A4Z1J234_9HELO|nr:hypothetical protein BOTNAR_0038g00320 [Botryotinia narcissicola]
MEFQEENRFAIVEIEESKDTAEVIAPGKGKAKQAYQIACFESTHESKPRIQEEVTSGKISSPQVATGSGRVDAKRYLGQGR